MTKSDKVREEKIWRFYKDLIIIRFGYWVTVKKKYYNEIAADYFAFVAAFDANVSSNICLFSIYP